MSGIKAAISEAITAAEDLRHKAILVSTYLDIDTPSWLKSIRADAEKASSEFRFVLTQLDQLEES